tara:strand:+ start:159 stop:614 length:456 start_codon:yes stop_codon:yes gene_type:complete
MRKAIIVDLDGTVALIDRRRELAMKPNGKLDWDIFLDPENISLDEPNRPIINLVQLLQLAEYNVIIVTGRYQRALGETIKWLAWNSVPHTAIFTRANSDYREDSIVKREIFEHHIREHWDVRWVIDDRKRVVDMWRNELNLTVLQVAEGDH